MSSFLQPHGLKPARLLCPWDFPGQNTGVGSHSSPLQGIFLTQGLNPHFLLGRQILYHWATREALFVQKGENTGLAKKFRFFHNIVQKNPNELFCNPVEICTTQQFSEVTELKSWRENHWPWVPSCPFISLLHTKPCLSALYRLFSLHHIGTLTTPIFTDRWLRHIVLTTVTNNNMVPNFSYPDLLIDIS